MGFNFEITDENLLNYTKNNSNKVMEISAEKLLEIAEQDFEIHNETVESLVEGIKINGQLEPCLVVKNEEKDGYYDLLAGRHRRRACQILNIPVKCIILDNVSEEDKRLIIIDTNINRNNDYKPSELAFAYKHKRELLKKKVGGATYQIVAEQNKVSKKQIYRYIRLTYLYKPLLDMVDKELIPVTVGSELSHLSNEDQEYLYNYLTTHPNAKATTNNYKQIRENIKNLDAVFLNTTAKNSTVVSNSNDSSTPDTSNRNKTDTKTVGVESLVDNDTLSARNSAYNSISDNPATTVTDNEEKSEISENKAKEKVSTNVSNVERNDLEVVNSENEIIKTTENVYSISMSLTEEELSKLGFNKYSNMEEVILKIKELIANL